MDGNALMRLSCEGEQPIDRYVKHKNDIEVWYSEMRSHGLDRVEIEVMKKHLGKSYGVASTQEAVMRLSMDKQIAGFDLVWANKLRKAIAKAKAKHLIAEVKEEFMKQGTALGNRRIFLEYVWDSCIVPMLGYGFSEPHLAGYSLILVQEMNIAHYLSALHWSVGCLCVNAGDINDNVTKGTDYGAIAKAIGGMEKGFVTSPYINKAGVGFKPHIQSNSCTFGLGAINGISNELAKEIISLRPFESLQDFIEKCVETKIVQPSKMYKLIKSGAFDELEPDRVKAMVEFINYQVPDKTKLTTANIAKLLEFGVVPNEMIPYIELLNFKKFVFNKANCIKMYNNTQGLYKVKDVAISYFEKNLEQHMMEAVEYNNNGDLCLKSKEFDKAYKKLIAPLTDWLKSEEAVATFNWCNKNVLWQKYCKGTLSKWEMDSISFYCKHPHELDAMELERFYDITNFSEIPSTPTVYYYENSLGRKLKRNNIYVIAGTVVEKNKNKSIVTLNTQHGVVEVKMPKPTFTKFDRKTPEEASWFTRGNKLLFVGYRRGELFIPKIYQESIFTSSIMKVEQDETTGRLDIQTERKFDQVDFEDNNLAYI